MRAIILETTTVAGLLELSLRNWLGVSTSSFGGFSSVAPASWAIQGYIFQIPCSRAERADSASDRGHQGRSLSECLGCLGLGLSQREVFMVVSFWRELIPVSRSRADGLGEI